MKPKQDPLLSLPGCVSRCDVCNHEPIESWLSGFGCNVCKGADAVFAEMTVSWGTERSPVNSSGGSS